MLPWTGEQPPCASFLVLQAGQQSMGPPAAFELANVGAGPDPCSVATLAADNAFVLVLFQRSPSCINCKKQVQAFGDSYDEFRTRNVEVVSVVPGDRDDVAAWQEAYDLPFPLLVDPNAATGDEYEQPVRFGLLGRLSDFLGRMPKAVLIDCRGTDASIAWTHEGNSTFDRPEIESILETIDHLA